MVIFDRNLNIFIMKKTFTLFGLLLIAVGLFSQPFTPISDGEYVEHTYYSLAYDEFHEQAKWVYYEITSSSISGNVSRTDDFRADPKVSTKSAELVDYRGSGYDRGHLAPAGSMTQNRVSMSESFYMSNMSPQHPSFNRGIWQQVESTVRSWVKYKGKLYIVTGPVFHNYIEKIGLNEVTVPAYYYKIVYSPSDHQMIAFLLENEKGDRPIENYIVTVDYIQEITGIDFFSQLEDEYERRLESSIDLSAWMFHSSNTSYSSSEPKKEYEGQCKGIAKSTGKRCRNKGGSSGYCRYHGK